MTETSDRFEVQVLGSIFKRLDGLWRRRRPDSTAGLGELTAALKGADCPICARLDRVDERWNSYFLNEGYLEPEVQTRLRRGAGFCARHACKLESSGLAGTLAFAHLDILRDAQNRLTDFQRGKKLIADPGYCIVCDHRRDAERRESFFLALLLSGRGLQIYARPAVVCAAHLIGLVEQLDPRLLPGVIESHLGVSGELREAFAGLDGGASGNSAETAATEAIRRLAGPPQRQARQRFDGGDPGSCAEPDPVKRFRRRLGEASACPVCEEVAISCMAWIGWLDGAAADSGDISDVVPLCPHHVWQALGRSGRALALPIAHALAKETHTRLRFAQQSVSAVHPGRRRLRSHALGSLRGFRECPLCRRARQARDRALLLLGALLEETGGRSAFEHSYGLCMPHAVRAFDLLGRRDGARVVAAVMQGRLSVLRWELEEQLRRYSWSARPEGHGAEAAAGPRATLRFSGTVCDNGP